MAQAKGIFIVGGSGFLGTHLALRLKDKHRVISTYQSYSIPIPGVLSVPLTFQDDVWLKTLILRFQPDVILYIIGNRDVEWVEGNQKTAERLHATGPGEILKHAEIYQPKLIYVSTCYVFDGQRGNYKETDSISPANALGKFKAGGENFIYTRSHHYNIIRTSPIYGIGHPWRPTLVDTLRVKLSNGERIELQNYELHSFAPVSGIADVVEKLIDQGPKQGIYHYGGLTRLTHYEFGVMFAKAFGFNPGLITPRKKPSERLLISENQKLDFSLNSSEIIKSLQVQSYEIGDGLKKITDAL